MAFTNSRCRESGVWAGRCGHQEISLHRGERFPECSECRRGIAWHKVARSPHERRDPREAFDDWADEGWWPGKDSDAGWAR